jgi:hypothetical protein
MSITSDRSDHTTGTTTTEPVRAPQAPSRDRARPHSRRVFLGWGAVAAACLAAGALAVTVLSGGDDTQPAPAVPAHPGIVANGSPRAIDGSVEDSDTVSAGPGIAENGSPRAIDGTVERPLPPTAEATGSNVEDMPPVASRGTFAPSGPDGPSADEQPADEPPPVVSRMDPPL